MGFLDGFFSIWKSWERLHEKEVPKWVLNGSHDFQDKFTKKYGHNPYDVTKHFVGITFIYRVFYKIITQGEYVPIYFRKLR